MIGTYALMLNEHYTRSNDVNKIKNLQVIVPFHS